MNATFTRELTNPWHIPPLTVRSTDHIAEITGSASQSEMPPSLTGSP